MPHWSPTDLSFEFVSETTSGAVVTADISTPAGMLRVMAELEEHDRTLVLRGFHIELTVKPNSVGLHNLRTLAQVVMERMDYDELVIEGATRTTGAGPGRLPGRIRFTRRDVPAPSKRP